MTEQTIVLHKLPQKITCLISSTQVITSVSSAVKELLENSLDAGGAQIYIKLENYGLNIIQVQDDGRGISSENVNKMFLSGHTSKINDFNDLGSLSTYGFRGEALSALCRNAEINVTTKTEKDTVAMTYYINEEGVSTGSVPSHLPKGTTITAKNLFKALPVRKQYLSSKKKLSEELKKVEIVVKSLAVIHPKVKMVLTHNNNVIWQKNSVCTLKQSFMQVVGLRHASKMELLEDTHGEMKITLLVPKKDTADVNILFSSMPSHSFIFVNERPVFDKEISKIIEGVVSLHWKIEEKRPLFLASILVPPSEIDVNLEPNKTKILFTKPKEVISLISHCVQSYYNCIYLPEKSQETNVETRKVESDDEMLTKKPKLDDSFQMEEKSYKKPITDCEETDSICSQINRENCVMASEKEISDLSKKFIQYRQQIVDSANMCTDDIQKNLADKILPDWPIRQTTPIKNHEVSTNDSGAMDRCTEQNLKGAEDQPMESTQQKFEQILWRMENSTKKPEFCVQAWSRGHYNLGNGEILKGGAALVIPGSSMTGGDGANRQKIDGKRSANNEPESSGCAVEIEPASMLEDDVARFNLSIESVSSQMGKKEYSGFTKFAQISRPKIIAENPNILFTKVSSLLVERWQALGTDEKEYYKKMATAVDEERKKHIQKKVVPVMFEPPKKKEVGKIRLQPKPRPPRRRVRVAVTIDEVIKLREVSSKVNQAIKRNLIGRLEPTGDWLFYTGDQICHVRHQGLQEIILLHKMLNSYDVPRVSLERRQYLTEHDLGHKNWEILVSLDSEFAEHICRPIVTSSVLAKNGFHVELLKTDTGDVTSAILTESAADIDNYGVADLIEALQLYKTHGEKAEMSVLRPQAVTNYIEKEVRRITTANIGAPDREEMDSLLTLWQQNFTHFPPKCLHERDIFVPIYYSSGMETLNGISPSF